MRCLVSGKHVAACAALIAVLWGGSSTGADGRTRYYPPRPASVRPPSQHYARRYFGPATTFGSTSYALANRPFAYPPFYGPYSYGYASVGTYVYPPPFGGDPYALYRVMNPLYYEPYTNPVLQESMLENQLRWGPNLPPSVSALRVRTRLHPSTPEQQAKSIHAQAQGDVWMRRLKFLNAYERYKYAIGIANDRPEPYFRIGFALAAVGNYPSAVKYIKQGLDLDPHWPAHGERLEGVFGDDNRLAILSLIERVTGWVRDDIRDPDRLFLIGVLLHFNGDQRASQFFEAAYRLAGSGDHLLAFLRPADVKDDAIGSQPGPRGGQDAPNGAQSPPAPIEPPLSLDAIPGAALNPNGVNAPAPARTSPPTPPLPNQVVPFFSRPANPAPAPRFPQNPRWPNRGPQNPPNAGPPAKAAPQPAAPATPALPLPPLPVPVEPGPAESGPKEPAQGSSSNSQLPPVGPVLTPPANSNPTDPIP